MARTAHPAPKPPIVEVFDSTEFRLHWYDRPGAPWTSEQALGSTIREVTVHWSEANTPGALTLAQYQAILAREAYFHAFQRNWNDDATGPFQGGDGLMYHYAIAPSGVIFQTTPETKRTWNAYSANAWNLAIVLMAGHADPLYPAAQRALTALLDWFVTARADLPGVTALPQTVPVLSAAGPTAQLQTYGVLTHDESLIRQGRPPKGCCGIYSPTVKAWRAQYHGA